MSVPAGPNLVPNRYRGVSVTTVPAGVALEAAALRAHLLGRDAYRRTRFVVARSGERTALLYITRASDTELFSPIVAVELLAGPPDCAFVVEDEADVAIPSVLAAIARRRAPDARAVAVQGRYAHVNVILEPQPLVITVREVVPPQPAKLLDQARRVLAVTESLRPIELVGELTELAELAGRHPAEHYLLPCRGSGGEIPRARVSYLDEHPPRAAWTLLGCARSRQIHRWFYGEDPPTVDFCPKRAVEASAGPVLTKCCLQEEHVESGPGWASVPWGSSLDHIREALDLLAAQEPSWAPG
ncbi:DUF7714 family protein [Pseudonocardia asaccharolytica]|uniref:Uncharacterized protein n=1 Tax=Pseudonocardia asaccharolytica DSM 44247 = NBRC 16224 TaxID=1123024 RepID=A0A511D5R7_9PSEU|nr:hypothetical protein [Pseudonocardia asaccharolytica]GEL20142.1 hypothetical protein PA7_39790 [Pseudonocardia asaccharolytica DSM 44247 = NBRC 16224]